MLVSLFIDGAKEDSFARRLLRDCPADLAVAPTVAAQHQMASKSFNLLKES